jgi:hypothetical protein
MIRTARSAALSALFLLLGASAAGAANDCTAETFATAVDKFGASLRTYNAEAQPRMRQRLTTLADKKGWTGEGREERAMIYLEDGRLAELDRRANDLLGKVDQLGRPAADGTYDCGKLADIEEASIEMLAVMKAKAAYLEDKIGLEVGEPKREAAAPAPPPAAQVASPPPAAQVASPPPAAGPTAKIAAPNPKPASPAAAKPETAPKAEPSRKAEPAPKTNAAPVVAAKPDDSWTTKTKPLPPAPSGPQVVATPPNGGEPYALPPVTFETAEEGYTIDEIREATRGFFGTISTNLASVIEYAFANTGRPTGYILGNEGGGAFLAGLRYGKGTLYLRRGGTRPIHWHGPSLGYDVGAEGGRTLILVYRMREPDDLYRAFTGVDGSAYLVGGVGMTLLKGGDVIMAPIRSGIGLRLGANIGYLRFTSQPTWNPF